MEQEKQKQRKRGRKKGQVVQKTKPVFKKATAEQLESAQDAYRAHVRLCLREGLPESEIADIHQFARQYAEVREVEEREPVGEAFYPGPFQKYGQYVSPTWEGA